MLCAVLADENEERQVRMRAMQALRGVMLPTRQTVRLKFKFLNFKLFLIFVLFFSWIYC